MIKENEIRIGNKFLHNGNWSYRELGEPTIITWCARDWHGEGQCTMDLNDLSGVPLSEEWLIKCKRPYWLFKDHQGGYWFSFGGHKRELKFVHQLQNANYVLEGEELEFKL